MDSFKPERDLLKALGYKLLSEGKVLRIRADGYSMYPQIGSGWFLLIEPITDISKLKENDIVAFKRAAGMVVHRLIRIEHDGTRALYITRGDSCIWEDEPIEAERIVGRVRAIFSGEKFEKRNPITSGKINYHFNNVAVKFLLIRDKIKRIFDY